MISDPRYIALLVLFWAVAGSAVGQQKNSTTSLPNGSALPMVQNPAVRVEVASSDSARAVLLDHGTETLVVEAETLTVTTTKEGFVVSSSGMASVTILGKAPGFRVRELQLTVPFKGRLSLGGTEVVLR